MSSWEMGQLEVVRSRVDRRTVTSEGGWTIGLRFAVLADEHTGVG